MSKKSWDSNWMHFSKRARRGIVVLLVLFIIVAIFPRIYYNYFYKPTKYEVSYSSIANEVDSTKVQPEEGEEKAERYTIPEKKFNPNDYSVQQWMQIGLSEKQAATIKNYLKSGAVLRIKSDVKKLFVIDDYLYELLEPKIDLPEANQSDSSLAESNYSTKSYDQESKKSGKDTLIEKNRKVEPVPINTASAWELKEIPGIGPYFAKEIIKIREQSGGIVSLNQLFEIYNMDKEKLETLKPYFILDDNEALKLNINTASEEELRNHPMIDYNKAKSIVYYRENYGSFKSIDEIMLTSAINRTDFQKIKPFIKVD